MAADRAGEAHGWVGAQQINLGTGGGISNQEIVNYVKEHYDADFRTVVTAPRLGDPAELVAQVDRAHEWLNWTAEYSDISTIIDSAYKWYTRV
jgi:UDP-glucose 4-epimerase